MWLINCTTPILAFHLLLTVKLYSHANVIEAYLVSYKTLPAHSFSEYWASSVCLYICKVLELMVIVLRPIGPDISSVTASLIFFYIFITQFTRPIVVCLSHTHIGWFLQFNILSFKMQGYWVLFSRRFLKVRQWNIWNHIHVLNKWILDKVECVISLI